MCLVYLRIARKYLTLQPAIYLCHVILRTSTTQGIGLVSQRTVDRRQGIIFLPPAPAVSRDDDSHDFRKKISHRPNKLPLVEVGKTRDGRTSVTVKMGKTSNGTVRDI